MRSLPLAASNIPHLFSKGGGHDARATLRNAP